MIGVEQTYQI